MEGDISYSEQASRASSWEQVKRVRNVTLSGAMVVLSIMIGPSSRTSTFQLRSAVLHPAVSETVGRVDTETVRRVDTETVRPVDTGGTIVQVAREPWRAIKPSLPFAGAVYRADRHPGPMIPPDMILPD